MGQTSFAKVQAANEMVSRVCLLLLLAMAVGSTWLLEQPASSLVFYHTRMREMLKCLGERVRVPWLPFIQSGYGRTESHPNLISSLSSGLGFCFGAIAILWESVRVHSGAPNSQCRRTLQF